MDETAIARAALPVTGERAYLNTASLGPVSQHYADELAAHTGEDLRIGRAIAARYTRLETARESLRAEIAALLQCEPARIVLTSSTSAGLGAVIEALPWQPDDEVITTDLEHEACAAPLRRLRDRYGVILRTAPLRSAPESAAAWLADNLTANTRLIAFSAVAFETGARLPVTAIAAAARAAGVPTLLDGAQCAGAGKLFPAAAGIDYCAIPLQKWLCGPEGLGALYVGPDTPHSIADRVTHGVSVFAAAAAQLRWMREDLGWRWIFERTISLNRYARETLAHVRGAQVLTGEKHAGIVTVKCPAAALDNAVDGLARRGFLVRQLPELKAFRISTAFFNTESELDGLAAALDAMSQPTGAMR